MPIYSMSPSMATVRRTMLLWGTIPVWSRRAESTDELIENSVDELIREGYIKKGDLTVVTAGVLNYRSKDSKATDTNIMRVVTIA